MRVQIVQGIDPDALAVPQQAVRRNDAGGSEVFLVRDDNRASVVQVRLGRAVDDHWLILDGVKPGDRVIVDGFQKFVAGDVVSPKPGARPGNQIRLRERRRRANDSRQTKGSDRWPPSLSIGPSSPGSSPS